MNEHNVTCVECDTEYNVAWIEEEADLRFCPFCGAEIVEELDFND